MPGDAHLCFEPSAGPLDLIRLSGVRAALFLRSSGCLLAFDIQWAVRSRLSQWHLFVPGALWRLCSRWNLIFHLLRELV